MITLACPPLGGILTLLLRHKIKKKKKDNKNQTEESQRQRSGQVAVRVLLAVHPLQILLLYQDVDAFLSTGGRQNANTHTDVLHIAPT